jgi:Rad3-related DNA helicase
MLCEFTAKWGDLGLRFTPPPSAQEGIAGHGIVTSRRASPYQAEVSFAYLKRFTPTREGYWFCNAGGAFGEAIDLPGECLTGAFIATLGLPQVNSVNEQVRNRMNAAFGQGYNYAYLFPGIRKVVQAAGRVIRSQLDQGVVYLIDDRFSRPQVIRLLPSWWKVEPGRQKEMDCSTSFWQRQNAGVS